MAFGWDTYLSEVATSLFTNLKYLPSSAHSSCCARARIDPSDRHGHSCPGSDRWCG